VTLYGQEKDAATSGLARMNMILHNNPTALIVQGNTLTSPQFLNGQALKTFDYVVANPPFSDKSWSNGLNPQNDSFDRFSIIGLPANLFFGTGIPACILLLDKEEAQVRKGIFMIDSSREYMKDGPKNRLRARDIHKIIDVFTEGQDTAKYGRMVSLEEIEKNEFNLNLPRYIDSGEPEDIQDIDGHLHGGIPVSDVEAFSSYWAVCPQLRSDLFRDNRPGYLDLAVEKTAIKSTISGHPEFIGFMAAMGSHFQQWKDPVVAQLKVLQAGFHPKDLIVGLSEGLLAHYSGKSLMSRPTPSIRDSVRAKSKTWWWRTNGWRPWRQRCMARWIASISSSPAG
jgi:type I restriction enzyme M protein